MLERSNKHIERSGLVVVKGNGLIDQFTPPVGPDDPFPKEYPPGSKTPVTTIEEAYERIGFRPRIIKSRIGGNGVNTAVDLSRLGRNVILQTPLGEDDNGNDIRERLVNESVRLDEQTTETTLSALVIPRIYIDETGKLRKDRTIFSITPDNLPAGFTYNGEDLPDFAYITSLKEPKFGQTYTEFTEFTDNKVIPRGVSPGSLQIKAVLSEDPNDRENKVAVYEAIKRGYLFGNMDELRALIDGAGITAEAKIDVLRLGKEVMGPIAMSITDGAWGSDYVDENGTIIHTPSLGKDSDVVATVGSGDAHVAGGIDALMNNFPAEMTARYGALDAKAVLKGEGAHETSLLVDQIRLLAEELYDDKEFRQTVIDAAEKSK